MRAFSVPAIVFLLTACSSNDSQKPGDAAPDAAPDGASEAAPDAATDEYSFKTATFEVAPAKEKYMCFTKTLEEDMWIDRFRHAGHPNVHHMVLVKTLAPEPEEPFECPTFFKPTWIPLFATGTADATLTTPEGSSFPLPKGTQLLVQLHLMNTGEDTASGDLDIHMRKVAQTESEAGIYGFGTTLIDLPAKKVSSVKNDCTVQNDVNFFAVFPHMHTLGKSIVFETGPDADHLHEEYRLDSWDFGEQFIAPHPFTLHAGDVTRTTCTYDNTRDTNVTFGESTENEMCFFTAFRTDFKGLDGCVELGGWAMYAPHGDGGAPPP